MLELSIAENIKIIKIFVLKIRQHLFDGLWVLELP